MNWLVQVFGPTLLLTAIPHVRETDGIAAISLTRCF